MIGRLKGETMTLQIKKKSIKADAIDESKVLINNDQALRAKKSDGSAKEVLKVNASDKIEFMDEVIAPDGVSEKGVVNKSQLSAEKDARIAGDSDLSASISAETTRAANAEGVLTGKYNEEKQQREDAVDGLNTLVNSVQSSLQSAIGTVHDEVVQESQVRSQAMSAEEAARIAGDAALQSHIDNVISNVDPSALDSLSGSCFPSC